MATESAIQPTATHPANTGLGAALQGGRSERRTLLADYWTLTKPEVNFLIGIATATGFCMAVSAAGSGGFPIIRLIHSLLGTLMVAGGTAALNQYVERRFDARMRRTARRPVVVGAIEPSRALRFGIVLSCAGAIYLAAGASVLASVLSVLTFVTYLFVYTPLKRRTPLCTLVGALAGATPPLIGWAAASGRLSPLAWVLYGVLFFWQFPHFMSIAWMYRKDYARAGYQVLPRGRRRISFLTWQTLLPSVALLPLTIAPFFLGTAGPIYLVAAALLTLVFIGFGARFILNRYNAVARRLLMTSIIYLPVLLSIMMLEKR